MVTDLALVSDRGRLPSLPSRLNFSSFPASLLCPCPAPAADLGPRAPALLAWALCKSWGSSLLNPLVALKEPPPVGTF